eukprot:TRINITY_DN1194_c0_g1_i2.p2 TRINITY_DN1194_c0_g1~~TRINITY_DN1194_c0_g1_i2.p2  ORF type:complete len:125 (+),score=29.48 TRINITY_DN1194_c0_g1_i2:927-1301(+)
MNVLVPELHDAYAEFGARTFMAMVYIFEAHASDEWPVGTNISCIRQPRTLEERVSAARMFVEKRGFKLPVLVDSMTNDFDAAFASWPLRFWVLHQGKVVYKAMPTPDCTYDVGHLSEFLRSYLS